MPALRPKNLRPDQCLALAWFYHRRFESLVPPLGIERFVLATSARKPWRELILALRTFALFCRKRPRLVFVQNPSMVSTLVVALLRPLFGYRIFVDAHQDAVEPFAHNWALVRTLTYWLLRYAELTVVTNSALARQVTRHGGTPFILFDNLPTPPDLKRSSLGAGQHVVFISTFAPDEPHAALFEAAARLQPQGIHFYITGRIKEERLRTLPVPASNVHLTGFLTEHAYWELLNNVDLIVDLTTMPDCLVCGAYEAVSLEQPLVLTDNLPSRELFGTAALYTDNSAESIAATVSAALSQRSVLREASRARAAFLQQDWNTRAAELKARMLGGPVPAAPLS